LDIAPCSLVEVDRSFSSACCLHHERYSFILVAVTSDLTRLPRVFSTKVSVWISCILLPSHLLNPSRSLTFCCWASGPLNVCNMGDISINSFTFIMLVEAFQFYCSILSSLSVMAYYSHDRYQSAATTAFRMLPLVRIIIIQQCLRSVCRLAQSV
jgi:hypothetical protein